MYEVAAVVYKWVVSFAFALVILGGFENPSRTEPSARACAIEERAAEFRILRTVRGHFSGGNWNDDADKWNGRKHQVMNQLGLCLGTGEYSKSEIIQWLGEPDHLAVKGNILFAQVESSDRSHKLSGDSQILIYNWRGLHDFLYFICQGEKIIDSGWWFAGE